jgi:hypothetical protein
MTAIAPTSRPRMPRGQEEEMARARPTWGRVLPGALAVVLAVAGVAIALPAHADGGPARQPRSGNPGLTPPNVATDVIATDFAIGPRPDEAPFPETRVVGVQLVPMRKLLRNGGVDPDHAIAEWFFSVRYPRSTTIYWPPFLPEPPNTPWRWHFFEMPDGELIGIGPEHGSFLHPPPPGLPADWLNRLIPAAKANITEEQFAAAVNFSAEDVHNGPCPGGFGLDAEEPCGEEEQQVAAAFDEAGQPPPPPPAAEPPPGGVVPPVLLAAAPAGGQVPPGRVARHVASLCTATEINTEICLTAVGIAGPVISRALERKGVAKMFSWVPCFGQTAEVIGWMAIAETLLIIGAFKNNASYIAAFGVLAMAAFGYGVYQYVRQVQLCNALRQLSMVSTPTAYAVAAAAIAALAASAAAILAVLWTYFTDIAAVRSWWGNG